MFPGGGPDRITMEQPSYYHTGDAIQTALVFAEATGVLKGILTALGWTARTTLVSPTRWMDTVDPSLDRPTGKERYRQRKKFFDSLAASLYPEYEGKIKFSEGDALCILKHMETR